LNNISYSRPTDWFPAFYMLFVLIRQNGFRYIGRFWIKLSSGNRRTSKCRSELQIRAKR